MVWGDHGWHLGDQRVWGKHTLFDNALRSQLIIKPANSFTKKQEIQTIVESVDIYPTLMEMCGLTSPLEIHGESFAPLFNNESSPKNVAYSYFNNGISLRTPQYRLTKYFREELPKIELYDHKDDPFETKNIAENRPDLIKQLSPILEEGNTGLYESNSK